ncbi:hypothetical protein GCM10017608_25660 [Agromyces luteolus]|nr:hypothetical protein GCM10017608_25660 [Agromyces luteolus]
MFGVRPLRWHRRKDCAVLEREASEAQQPIVRGHGGSACGLCLPPQTNGRRDRWA